MDKNYLEHHGILGQRWGHRNGPPYPLDAQDHSVSEKKAGWTKSLKTTTATAESHRTAAGTYRVIAKATENRAPRLSRAAEAMSEEHEREADKSVTKYMKEKEDFKRAFNIKTKTPREVKETSKTDEKRYNLNAKEIKKNMDKMTDAELQRAINRLNMQQQVARMNPSYVERGRKLMDQYKKDLGLIVGTITVSTGLITALQKLK